jgi:OmpA-OmpF porin, OOP family
MTRKITALLLLSSLALASPALAGPQEGDASFGVNAGSFMFDNAEKFDDGPVIGARLGYDLHRNVGLEASFGFTDTRSNLSVAKPQAYAYTYRTDLLYYLLPQNSLVPFLTAGGGILDINGSELWGNRTSLLLEYGLGVKYFISDDLALRADGRNLLSFDNNRHSHLEFTGGISYYFKKGRNVPVKPTAEIAQPAEVRVPAPPVPAKPAPVAAKQELPAVERTEPAAAAVPPAESRPTEPTSSQVPKAAAATPVAPPPPTATPAARFIPSPAAVPAAVSACDSSIRISKIATVPNGFEIVSDSPLAMPKEITLSGPARLALDLDCAVYGIGSKSLPFNHGGVTVVRIGNYPDKLRIVFDFNQAPVPPYKIVKSNQGIKVLFGNAAK